VEISALEAFLLVAERGSLTLAARELGLTQPGLSRQMQRLERAFGAALFVRTHAGVHLTPAGQRCRAYAREVVARHREFLAELRGGDAGVVGDLRVAASTTPAEFVVPRLVADFTARHPGARAVVFTTDSAGVAEELLDGRWDVGFVGARLARGRLRFDPVAGDEIVLAVPAHHPFARRREVALAALAGQPFVEREGGSGTLLSVRRALAARGLEWPVGRACLTVTTTRGVLAAVRAGHGIGFVSSLALAEEVDGRVVAVRLAGVPLVRQLCLVRERRRVLSPVASRFVDFVLREARAPDTA
jgi:DNA-binding transcriptional LysR family regulator